MTKKTKQPKTEVRGVKQHVQRHTIRQPWSCGWSIYIPSWSQVLLCDETIQWPRGWLQHGAVTEGADRVKSGSQSRSVMSNSLWSHGLYSPWNSPGQNSRVGSLSLLQRIFPTQGLNPGLETLQVDSLPAEPPGKPKKTGVGSLSLLQGIFQTQASNQGLLHYRQILYQLS